MITKIVKEKLNEVIGKLDQGKINEITFRQGYDYSSFMFQKPEIDENSHLPSLTGLIDSKQINLGFMPYPDGGYLLDIELQCECPFKLVLTLENIEVKSTKYKAASPIPVTEIEIGIKSFDDRYFIETLEKDKVESFLSHENVRKDLEELGEIDRFVFSYKFLKLIYYVPDLEKLDTGWIFEKINILNRISHNLLKNK